MIGATMFDLDGTLVHSEKLTAQSYAIAVQRLRSLSEPDLRAVEAYRQTVGASQDVASRHIIESLGPESDFATSDWAASCLRNLGGPGGQG